MKQIIMITLICSILLVVLPAVSSAVDVARSELKDISKHWAKGAIEQAVVKGYVSGYTDGSFQPDKQVTRAEFIRMLVDALKLPHVEQGSPWYQPYVAAVLEIGIHKEADFKSDYNKTLTRLEMVRLAIRATDMELQKSGAKVADKQFMYDATTKGIVHGMTNGELAPEGTSTRAQAVAIIERIHAVNAGGKLPTDMRAVTFASVALKGTNIEEMLGAEIYPLPMKLPISSGLDITLDQVIVVDYNDKNSAYRDWFPNVMKEDKKEVGNEYLIALHLKVKNLVIQEKVRPWQIDFVLKGPNDFREAFILEEYEHLTPIRAVPNVFRDEVKEYEGWYLIMAPKSVVEEQLKKDGNVELYFKRYYDQKKFYISKEKK